MLGVIIWFVEFLQDKKLKKFGRYRYPVIDTFAPREELAVSAVLYRLGNCGEGKDYSYVHNRLEELVELGFLAKEFVPYTNSNLVAGRFLYFKL